MSPGNDPCESLPRRAVGRRVRPLPCPHRSFHQLSIFEAALAEAPFLAGPAVSLADLTLFPVLVYVRGTPEGRSALQNAPSVRAWFGRMAARPSVAATDPARG